MTIASVLVFAAAVAALSLAVAGLVLRRGGKAVAALTATVILLCGLAAGWTLAQMYAAEDLAMHEARRALDARMAALTASALAPQSPLACLDAVAGDAVESACETALFASPQTVASSIAYLSARVSLLRDVSAFAAHYGAGHAPAIAPLAQALASDRFGFVAHVLATREGCTPENCALFATLTDASMLKINLLSRTYDAYVAKYQSGWAHGANDAVTASAPAGRTANPGGAHASGETPAALGANGHSGKAVNSIDFPTAASIPPISIMDPEPAGKAGIQAGKAGPAVVVPVPPPVEVVAPPRPKPAAKPAAKPPAKPPARPTANSSDTNDAAPPRQP